jgi:hypothetical protein
MISYEAQKSSQQLNSFSQGEAESSAKTENTQMTEEKKVVDLNTVKESLEGNFVQFPENERVKVGIVNWQFVEVEKTFKGVTETKIQFEADVVSENGEDMQKNLATVSKPFQREIVPLIEDKNPKQVLVVGVKRKGTGTDTTYDIELVE